VRVASAAFAPKPVRLVGLRPELRTVQSSVCWHHAVTYRMFGPSVELSVIRELIL